MFEDDVPQTYAEIKAEGVGRLARIGRNILDAARSAGRASEGPDVLDDRPVTSRPAAPLTSVVGRLQRAARAFRNGGLRSPAARHESFRDNPLDVRVVQPDFRGVDDEPEPVESEAARRHNELVAELQSVRARLDELQQRAGQGDTDDAVTTEPVEA